MWFGKSAEESNEKEKKESKVQNIKKKYDGPESSRPAGGGPAAGAGQRRKLAVNHNSKTNDELEQLRQMGLAKLLNRHFTETSKKISEEKAIADAALADLERRKAATSEFRAGPSEMSEMDKTYLKLNKQRSACRRKERETLLLYQRYVNKFGNTVDLAVPSSAAKKKIVVASPQQSKTAAAAALPPPSSPPSMEKGSGTVSTKSPSHTTAIPDEDVVVAAETERQAKKAHAEKNKHEQSIDEMPSLVSESKSKSKQSKKSYESSSKTKKSGSAASHNSDTKSHKTNTSKTKSLENNTHDDSREQSHTKTHDRTDATEKHGRKKATTKSNAEGKEEEHRSKSVLFQEQQIEQLDAYVDSKYQFLPEPDYVDVDTPDGVHEVDADDQSVISGITFNSAFTKNIMHDAESRLNDFLQVETLSVRRELEKEEKKKAKKKNRKQPGIVDDERSLTSVGDRSVNTTLEAEMMVNEMETILNDFRSTAIAGSSSAEPRRVDTTNHEEVWMAYYDETYKREYFVEMKTNKTQWHIPANAIEDTEGSTLDDSISGGTTDMSSSLVTDMDLSYTEVVPENDFRGRKSRRRKSRIKQYRKMRARRRKKRMIVSVFATVSVSVGFYYVYSRHPNLIEKINPLRIPMVNTFTQKMQPFTQKIQLRKIQLRKINFQMDDFKLYESVQSISKEMNNLVSHVVSNIKNSGEKFRSIQIIDEWLNVNKTTKIEQDKAATDKKNKQHQRSNYKDSVVDRNAGNEERKETAASSKAEEGKEKETTKKDAEKKPEAKREPEGKIEIEKGVQKNKKESKKEIKKKIEEVKIKEEKRTLSEKKKKESKKEVKKRLEEAKAKEEKRTLSEKKKKESKKEVKKRLEEAKAKEEKQALSEKKKKEQRQKAQGSARDKKLKDNEKDTRPAGCNIPLAYIVNKRCRRLAREKPVYNLGDMVNSMMQ